MVVKICTKYISKLKLLILCWIYISKLFKYFILTNSIIFPTELHERMCEVNLPGTSFVTMLLRCKQAESRNALTQLLNIAYSWKLRYFNFDWISSTKSHVKVQKMKGHV